MPLTLLIHGPAGAAPASRVVPDGGRLIIGRAAPSDLVLPDPSQRLSQRHCLIDGAGGVFTLTDGSTNGTEVNGVRIAAPRRLGDGDVIGIGPYRIEVRLADQRGATGPGPATPAADPLRVVAAALAGLEAARQQARRDLGLTFEAPLPPDQLLARLSGPGGGEAAAALVAPLVRHQAAALPALKAALNTVLAPLAPATLRQAHGDDPAALWKAYEAAFTGAADGRSVADAFAAAFRTAYDKAVSS